MRQSTPSPLPAWRTGELMDSDETRRDSGWPLDEPAAALLVARAIHDIDLSTDARRDVLLYDLLCAAWGSPWAQNQ